MKLIHSIALALLFPSIALAGPVVSKGGKPGVAASWTSSGTTVTLKLAAGYDAGEVAKAIVKGVPGASAKADAGKVIVTGLAEAPLLAALEKVEVAEAGDDVDQMLSSLQKPGGEEEGSGSSIRATQAADFSAVLGNKDEQITAKVVEVQRQRFPLALVTVKIAQVPKGAASLGLKQGAKVKVLPRVKSKNGVVDPADDTSKLNLGAWYAEPGDTVLLRLEKPAKDDVWIAAAFDRQTK